MLLALFANLVIAGFAEPKAIFAFDKPFLFSYGTWEGKSKIEGGRALLRGTPKGGGGVNVALNLRSVGQLVPTIHVKVGPTNSLAKLRLMFVDAQGRSGIWSFALPKSGDAWVTPEDGASIAGPTEVGKDEAGRSKGLPDISTISQWQLTGDWGGDGPVEVDVLAVASNEPSAADLAARKAIEDRKAEEARQAAEERRRNREQYGKVGPNSPELKSIYFLGPKMVVLEIVSGRIQNGALLKYVAEAGDTRRTEGHKVTLVRGGRDYAFLIGPNREWMTVFEKFEGDPLLDEYAADPKQFSLSLVGGASIVPIRVSRKVKPIDASTPGYEMVLRHRIYLELGEALRPGQKVRLGVGKLNVRIANPDFAYTPDTTWSEAVHVNQVGFRPDDPLKRAYLSTWLGDGGTHSFGDAPKFRVVDAKTGVVAVEGVGQVTKRSAEKEAIMRFSANESQTDVYALDFSKLKTPGSFRVVVDGVGTSDAFPIASDVWGKAFRIQMRGLFNNRSGMDLGPPYTNFRKPLDFHPKNGDSITQSTFTLIDRETPTFSLEKADTGKPVAEAWGGYHDAGDWNPRRATHLKVTIAQLEIASMFPGALNKMAWNIPKPTRAPDILNEALWELDLFRRLQLPNGAVRGGIETPQDPYDGEVSWIQSMKVYVYGPDPLSSWTFATAAARFSTLVQPFDAPLAATYRNCAIKAMDWAESEAPRVKAKLNWDAWDARNLAALEVYRLTGETRYHDVFLENTVLKDAAPRLFTYGTAVQTDAAFAYARLPKGVGDEAMKARAVAAIEREAQTSLKYGEGNGWNIIKSDPGAPAILGYYSTPGGTELARAHFLTGKPEYLAGVVQSTLFCVGANPSNTVYTSGLGTRPVLPFKIDYRLTGQPVPEGLTVYGNCDFKSFGDGGFFTWPIQWHISRVAVPNAYTWPIHEALFETYLYPGQLEYTVDAWAPNVYVWGYLAGRK